jgi:hypothetical protein
MAGQSTYAEAPADLAYKSFARGGGAIARPDLGIVPERPRGTRPAEIGTPAPDALDAVITEGVRPFLHGAVPVRDPGGSLPVRVGGALVLVRALHLGLPLVQAFVPLARGVPSTPALLEALNELNSNIMFGRAFWSGGAVIVAIEVPAADIRADQVTLACLQAGSLATQLTKELRDRLGDAFPVAISTNGPEPAN